MLNISLSIVSHGHGAHVLRLLDLLCQPGGEDICRVWITLNVKEPGLEERLNQIVKSRSCRFALGVIINPIPLGFGSNHNQAFLHEMAQSNSAPFFGVLNPDLSWNDAPWPAMLRAAASSGVGCVYTRQVDAQGAPQDYARSLPTFAALLSRYLARPHVRSRSLSNPDWVNAALLLFKSEVYEQLQGFDEAYRMYCEDVDICLRLQLAGYELAEANDACVVHAAQRASHRELSHLGWHLRSLWRLWHSPAYHQFRLRSRRSYK